MTKKNQTKIDPRTIPAKKSHVRTTKAMAEREQLPKSASRPSNPYRFQNPDKQNSKECVGRCEEPVNIVSRTLVNRIIEGQKAILQFHAFDHELILKELERANEKVDQQDEALRRSHKHLCWAARLLSVSDVILPVAPDEKAFYIDGRTEFLREWDSSGYGDPLQNVKSTRSEY